MRAPVTIALAVMLAAGCGKKDGGGKVATRSQELRTKMTTASGTVDNLIIKGELPDWKFDGFVKLQRTERVETKLLGKTDLVVMDLEFVSWGGTGKGEDDFKREMESAKAGVVGQQFAGEPITLAKELAEVRPKVWSFVTKAKDFADGYVYEVYVYHFDATLPLMHRCKGQARVTYAEQWPEIERICSGLSIELAPDNPQRAFYN